MSVAAAKLALMDAACHAASAHDRGDTEAEARYTKEADPVPPRPGYRECD